MNLIDFFLKGGAIMYPILLCSIIALYIIVERYMALRRAREIPEGFNRQLREFLRKGDINSAILYAAQYDIPLARVVKAGLQKIHRGYRRVQGAMEDQGRAEMGLLEKHMGVLATVAGVAPLLGFLGTVIGIAIAFQEIADRGGQVSADVLADGISQALYTTVFGLVVGIPAFALFNYLNGIIRNVVGTLENQAREIFDAIEEELPAEGKPRNEAAAIAPNERGGL